MPNDVRHRLNRRNAATLAVLLAELMDRGAHLVVALQVRPDAPELHSELERRLETSAELLAEALAGVFPTDEEKTA